MTLGRFLGRLNDRLTPKACQRKGLAGRLRRSGEIARAMVGIGSYDAYRTHMAAAHPDQTPMSPRAYFEHRQNAHYGEGGKGGMRCC